MTTYSYRGFDGGGKTAHGLIEALDLKEAREKLQARGVLAEKIAAAGAASGGRHRRQAFDLDQRAMCYRELAALLSSGLPLAAALEVLIQSPELGPNRARLAGVRDRLREGSTLARALRAASPEVSPFEEAGIEVGERVGTLDLVLQRLAVFMEEQAKLRDRVQTALIYPVFVLALAVLVAVGMLGFLLPWVSRRMLEAGVPLSGLTRGVLVFRRWVVPGLLLVAAAGWL
ncbi:MAG: type II secretion system F family protein, partial [Kiritimatiellaeota bacterium]|nr:type II secretion system F family protein [Kiritimatiellota bacterium]